MNLERLNELCTNGLNLGLLDILSMAAILFGILVIISNNPIVSVLFLIGLFLSIAIYLLSLGMNFIGFSYLLVYVGAVSILFLFILMLINVRISELLSNNMDSTPLQIFIIILSIVLPLLIFYNMVNDYAYFIEFFELLDIKLVSSPSWDNKIWESIDVTSVGQTFYNIYGVWLILVSTVLLLAMVGTIAITVKPDNEKSTTEDNTTEENNTEENMVKKNKSEINNIKNSKNENSLHEVRKHKNNKYEGSKLEINKYVNTKYDYGYPNSVLLLNNTLENFSKVWLNLTWQAYMLHISVVILLCLTLDIYVVLFITLFFYIKYCPCNFNLKKILYNTFDTISIYLLTTKEVYSDAFICINSIKKIYLSLFILISTLSIFNVVNSFHLILSFIIESLSLYHLYIRYIKKNKAGISPYIFIMANLASLVSTVFLMGMNDYSLYTILLTVVNTISSIYFLYVSLYDIEFSKKHPNIDIAMRILSIVLFIFSIVMPLFRTLMYDPVRDRTPPPHQGGNNGPNNGPNQGPNQGPNHPTQGPNHPAQGPNNPIQGSDAGEPPYYYIGDKALHLGYIEHEWGNTKNKIKMKNRYNSRDSIYNYNSPTKHLEGIETTLFSLVVKMDDNKRFEVRTFGQVQEVYTTNSPIVNNQRPHYSTFFPAPASNTVVSYVENINIRDLFIRHGEKASVWS